MCVPSCRGFSRRLSWCPGPIWEMPRWYWCWAALNAENWSGARSGHGGPDIARGRRWHRAESLHADYHTRADLRARHRDLCPKRLQDLQLCWLSSPWEGSWKAFSAKSCLACVLAAEWVRFNLKRHLGFKTYPQIQEWTRPQSKDKSTSLGVSHGLLGLMISVVVQHSLPYKILAHVLQCCVSSTVSLRWWFYLFILKESRLLPIFQSTGIWRAPRSVQWKWYIDS